jgi:hypothetical protein
MADLWLSKKIDLRIKEAKNLNGEIDLFNLLGVMNAQCKISVDSADLCETSTVESDNPLWVRWQALIDRDIKMYSI